MKRWLKNLRRPKHAEHKAEGEEMERRQVRPERAKHVGHGAEGREECVVGVDLALESQV